MLMSTEEMHLKRITILEDTLSQLIGYLREKSNTSQGYLDLDHLVKGSIDKKDKVMSDYNTDASYVK